MRRIFRILRLFWTTALAAEMEYRLNFLLATLTSLGTFAGSLFTLSLFYRQKYAFAGWTWNEALLVMGLFTVLEGFTSTLLSPNLSRIVVAVREGTLDFMLLKPLDTQLHVSTRYLSPWGFPSVAFGLIVLVYAGTRIPLPPAAYMLGLLPIALALVILYALWFILATMTIWFVKIYNVTEALRNVLEAGRYPVAAFPPVFQFIFTFILPVTFLTTVPAETMLARSGSWRWLLAEAALAAGLFAFSRWFWRFALRSYTSASS